jgi:hypothetical protein
MPQHVDNGVFELGDDTVWSASATTTPVHGVALNQTDVPLDAGQTLTLTGITPASYDLRVIFSDGSHEDNRGFTVTSGTLVSIQEN